MTDADEPSLAAEQTLFDKWLVQKLIIGVIALFGLVLIAGWYLRPTAQDISHRFVEEFGLQGIFIGTMIIDSLIIPAMTHEPLLFFGYADGMSYWLVLLTAGTASTLAGPLAYVLGRVLGSLSFVHRFLGRSGLGPLMRNRGFTVVALAALTPLPFSSACWIAGATQMAFGRFCLACTLRYAKVAFYLGLIAAGWNLT